MEFVKYPKIARQKNLQMSITQKLHGTNAQICIYPLGRPDTGGPLMIKAGSRNRWLDVDNDNYGFARFVEDNKEELIEKMGVGRHYGEWVGPGINSGEGLSEKVFALFEWYHWPEERELPKGVITVPVMYHGPLDLEQIQIAMESLKEHGSALAPGFMRPEGVVTSFANIMMKSVFDPEETAWTKSSGKKNPKPKTPGIDYSHLCQPIRLEKLISKDEQLSLKYPETLPQIVKEYMNDLVEEGEIAGDKDEIKLILKGSTGQVFKFIKQTAKDKGW